MRLGVRLSGALSIALSFLALSVSLAMGMNLFAAGSIALTRAALHRSDVQLCAVV